ncbi:MAG: hypothetical protein M1834_003068 [Cirrosporium novae-zelandiae]|nr:MAG: hypothetical protein M1834_003068 [Cirrosporium novae-zelandiae]
MQNPPKPQAEAFLQSKFLASIPPEIRIQIYKEVLVYKHPIPLRSYTLILNPYSAEKPKVTAECLEYRVPGLLQVNSQIRAETDNLFWNKNVFYINASQPNSVNSLFTLPEHLKQELRHLCIYVDRDTYVTSTDYWFRTTTAGLRGCQTARLWEWDTVHPAAFKHLPYGDQMQYESFTSRNLTQIDQAIKYGARFCQNLLDVRLDLGDIKARQNDALEILAISKILGSGVKVEVTGKFIK